MPPQALIESRDQAVRKVRTGAMYFYFIAALTLLNSLMLHLNIMQGQVLLPASLYIVQLIDFNYTELNLPVIVPILADILFVGLYVFLGYMAGRRDRKWAFQAGTIFYAADMILFSGTEMNFDMIFSLIFGAFVIIMLMGGYRALKKLDEIQDECAKAGFEMPAYAAPPRGRFFGLLRPEPPDRAKVREQALRARDEMEQTVFSIGDSEKPGGKEASDAAEAAASPGEEPR
ncbi:MAG: hypothetical protein ACOX88_05970 [Christensenellales bacterium]